MVRGSDPVLTPYRLSGPAGLAGLKACVRAVCAAGGPTLPEAVAPYAFRLLVRREL